MDFFLIIALRIIHILTGIFWVGVVMVIAGFLEPNARALGPEANKFMQRLTKQMRLTDYTLLAAFLNVLSGIWLYWILSSGFQMTWISSGMGILLTAGGILAIIALVLGLAVTKPTLVKMGKVGQEIQASEGAPAPELMAVMQVLQAKLRVAGRVGAVLLIAAVITMASARYLTGVF